MSSYTTELLKRQLIGKRTASGCGLDIASACPFDAVFLDCSRAELTKAPPEGVSVGPKDDNLFCWEVMIVGPSGTL